MLPFVHLVCCVVGKGEILWGRSFGGERPLFVTFPCLYHLSSLKVHFVVYFLVWFGSFYFFSFGFHSLSDKEVTDMATLLSLLEGHPFRFGGRDVRFWNSNSLEGFPYKFFFLCLVDPSSLGELVFSALWRIMVPRKVRFLLGRFFTVVLNACQENAYAYCAFLLYSLLEGGGRPGPYSLKLRLSEQCLDFLFPSVWYDECLP